MWCESDPAARNLMAGIISPLNWAVSLSHRATFNGHTPDPLCIRRACSPAHACFFSRDQSYMLQLGFCPNTHDTDGWMDVRESKWTTAWNNRWRKPRPKTHAEWEDKEKRARGDEIRDACGWKTRTGRREDRTLRLRKMLFNPWIRRGLVVFTLICVCIDFLFNFNLSSVSQPCHPAYFTLQRVSSLRGFFLSLKPPKCHHQVSANTNQSLPLILSLCSHQSFLGRSILLFLLHLPLSQFQKPLHEQ